MGAAVAAVSSAGSLITAVENLFGGSGFPQQKTVIDGWVTTIRANIANINNPATPAGDAWLRLRCWSGDQTVITAANTQELFGGPRTAAGCGCESAHGCLAYAQAAVTTLKAYISTQNVNTGIGGGLNLSSVSNLLAPTSTGGINPLLLVILGVGAFLLLRKKG